MTAIVGLEHGGKVYIGADSAATDGWLRQSIRSLDKVFTNGPFVIGSCGSVRMSQLLRYGLSVPEQPSTETDDYRFMVTTFVNAVRKCFKDGGWMKTLHDVESGGSFLVGYRGSLYDIHGDFQVGHSICGFAAVGCGDDLAMGAMAASALKDPEKRITQALEVAAQFSAGVAAPFTVVSL